jgi:hypothetical protein
VVDDVVNWQNEVAPELGLLFGHPTKWWVDKKTGRQKWQQVFIFFFLKRVRNDFLPLPVQFFKINYFPF